MLTRRTFVKAMAAIPVLGAVVRIGAERSKGPKVVCDDWDARVCDWIPRDGSSDWNDPKNWVAGQVPRNGDYVQFLPHHAKPTMPNDVDLKNLFVVADANETAAKAFGYRVIVTSPTHSG